MTRCTIVTLLCAAALGGSRAHGQGTPPGWQWRLDADERMAGQQAVQDPTPRFDQMPPGWHITTGPAGLLYPSAERAAGLFSLVADFVVFPETTDSGFGLFVGGSELESESPSYVAALLRRDGAYRVTRHTGGREEVLVPWTTHSAIRPHSGSGVVTNRLRVHASADSLRVFVNDSAVARLPVGSALTEGRFGFRVGERVNLHLTILDHIRHLAPARAR